MQDLISVNGGLYLALLHIVLVGTENMDTHLIAQISHTLRELNHVNRHMTWQ